MTLADSLQKQFRADLRFRGEGYLDADRVQQIALTPDKLIVAVQEKAGEFTCELDRTGGELRKSCSCPQFGRMGVCKHLWGAVLLADRDGILTGPVQGGEVPPFAAEDPSAGFSTAWDFEEEDDADYAPGPGGGLPRRAATAEATDGAIDGMDVAVLASPEEVAAAAHVRPWEKALAGVAAEVAAPRKGSAAERQIFYELDLDASRRERRVVIQVSQRQRRANGQWGKLKALRVRSGDLDTIDREEDRTVLAYLFGGVAERDAKAGTETGQYRFHLAHELAERLLPLMCATGNARVLDAGEKSKPLTWDGDEPWELTAALRETDDSPTGVDRESEEESGGDAVTLRLGVELTRPDAVRRAGDADLLLPGGLVLLDGKLAPVQDFGAYDLAERIAESGGIEIPHDEAPEAVEKLFRLPVLPRLELPEDQRLEEVRVEPGRELVISSGATAQGRLPDRATGVVRFRYDGEPVAGGDPRWAIVKKEDRKCLLRDADAEASAWGDLRDAGFRRLAGVAGGPDVEVAIGDLGSAVRSLSDSGWAVRADDKPIRQAGELRFQVKSGIDWFELRGDVNFGGATIALPDLLAALARGDDAVKLSDGSLGILPPQWAEQLGLLAGLGTEEEDHIKFAANQAVLLDTLLGAQEEVSYDEQFATLRERLRGLGTVEPAAEPEGFEGELREYQQNGLGWMTFLQDTNLGGCLADDMGLGKTVQLLALLQGRKRRVEAAGGERRPSLVVVPRSLLFNWESEAHRFTPDLSVRQYTGPDRHSLRPEFPNLDLILTTYGTLRRDVMDLKSQPFDYVVLDEAQTIKNATSQVSKAARLAEGPAPAGPVRHADREPRRRPVEHLRVPQPGHARPQQPVPPLRRRPGRPPGPRPARQGDRSVRSPPHEGRGRHRPAGQNRDDAVGRAGGRTAAAVRGAPRPLPPEPAGPGEGAGYRQGPHARPGSPAAAPSGRLPPGPAGRGARRGAIGEGRGPDPPAAGTDRRGTQGAGVQPVHLVPRAGPHASGGGGRAARVPRRPHPRPRRARRAVPGGRLAGRVSSSA